MKTLDETLFGRALGGWRTSCSAIAGCFSFRSCCCSACASFTHKNILNFDPNRDDLVGSNKKYHQNYLHFKKEFPRRTIWWWWSKARIRKKTGSSSSGWARSWRRRPTCFTDVFYKGDLKMIGPKALLFVPEDDLKELRDTLTDYLPFISNSPRRRTWFAL